MKNNKRAFFIILATIVVTVIVTVFGIGTEIKGVQDMRFGIDIRGGVEAVFEPEGLDRKPKEREINAARKVIETRLDSQNILDREVTVDKKGGYVIVRFPWKSDETNFNPEEAIKELGEMAQLTFQDDKGNVKLEGKNIKKSTVARDEKTSEYVVELNFDAKGSALFEKATEELIGSKMGIYMDETLISNPMVSQKIVGGKAVINGMESYEEAQELSNKINAGALPFALKTTNFSTISPTLGNGALQVMVTAGILAFCLICIFMISYYRLPGIAACLTLTLQMALQLLALSVPQYTLTLPGMAGIILSLGMAVDANIIIAERISEELKKKRSILSSIQMGYKNGISSVLDGNITSAIVAVILMIFGSGAMLSFGYTLLTGLLINIFVGVLVSKKILLAFSEYKKLSQLKLFRLKKERKTISFFKKKKIYFVISSVCIVAGIVSCFTNGVHLDCQFTGGAVLNYTYEGEADLEALKQEVSKVIDRPVNIQVTTENGFKKQGMVITLAGNKGMSPEEQDLLTKCLNSQSKPIHAKLSETYVVEPYIGKQALKDAVIAIVLSSVLITIYVWIRFSVLSGLAAGITAMVALIHDVCIVFFSFVIFQIPLNDAFVAVVLTIIGYSINDTIVLYDRIREMRKEKPNISIVDLVNQSITQTMARSINTSVTTGMCVLIILAASLLFGIESIRVFSLPMFFGLVSGCYSSICIAGILWAMWEKNKIKRKGNIKNVDEIS